jgi:hypothetical protein
LHKFLIGILCAVSISGCSGSSGSGAIDTAVGFIAGDNQPTGPVLTAVPSYIIQQNDTLLVDVNNERSSAIGTDEGMVYVCTWDRTLDGVVDDTTLCPSLPGTLATFTSADGKLAWTPSIAELGDYEIKIKGVNSGGSATRVFSVSVRLDFDGITSITTVQGDQMTLNWTANASATGYQIMQRNTDGTFTLYQTITGGTTNTVTLTGLSPLTTYGWKIWAVDAIGNNDANQVYLSAVTSDLIRLEISSAATQLSAGQSSLVTLILKDNGGNILTNSGLAVTFLNDGTGTSDGTFSSVNDLGNGTYTSTFTATTPGTLTKIIASIPQFHFVQVKASMTVSPLRIEILSSGGTVNPGTSVNLTAKIRDFSGALMSIGGHGLTFSNSGGTSTGTFSAVTDNGNGTYSATFTGGTAGTATTLSASISTNSTIYSTTTVTVQAFNLEITSSLPDVSVTRTATVTGRIKDWQGNYLTTGGKSLTLSISGVAGIASIGSTTDVGNGTYTATITGVSLGTITVTGAISQSYTVTVSNSVNIKKLRLEFLTSAANLMPGGIATLTGRVKDWQGNIVGVGGHGMSISTTGGTSTGTIGPITDNGNGTYSSSFTAGSAGTAVNVTGTISDIYQVDLSPTITVKKWLIYVSASSNTVSAGQSIILTATVQDYLGTQSTSGGQSVFFSFSGGTSSGTIGTVTDNNNGTYSATYTGVTPGTSLTVSASLAESYQVNATTTVTVEAIQLLVSTSQSSLNPGDPIVISAQIQSLAGANLVAGAYSIGFSYSGGTSTGTFSATTAMGAGLYQATFTGSNAGTAITLSANANVSYSVATPAPTVTVVPWKIEITTAATSITIGQSTLVTGRIKNWQNQYLTSGGDNLSLSLVTAGRGSISSVTDNSDGTYSATFLASGVGSTNVTGSLSKSYTVTVSPSITVVAVHLELIATQTSLNPGDNITIQAQVKDSFGANLTTGSYTIGFSYSGGTSTGTVGSTLDLGMGLYSVQFSGLVSGTATTITANANMSYVVDNTVAITVVPWKIEITTSDTSFVIKEVGTLTGRIKDWQNQYLTAGGKSMNLSLVTAGIGNLGATTDNSDGTYTASFQAAGQGTTIVAANISQSNTTTVTPTLTVEKVFLDVTLDSPETTSTTVRSGSTVLATVRLKDSGGQLVTATGYNVSFATSGGSSTISQSAVVESSTGVYQANFQGILAGTALTVTASATIPFSVNSTASLSVNPSSTISATNSALSISAITVRSGEMVTLTATLKDAAGNVMPGLTGLVFANSGGTSTGTFGAVSEIGNGVYTVPFTGVTPGTATLISVTKGGVTASQTAFVSVTAGAPSLLTVSGPSSVYANSCSAAFRLDFFDSNSNATTLASSQTFSFGGTGLAKYYSNSNCTAEITQLDVLAGQLSSPLFYLKSYDPTSLNLNFTTVGITQTPADHALTVVGVANWIGMAGVIDTIGNATVSNNYFSNGKYDGALQGPYAMAFLTISGTDYLFLTDTTENTLTKIKVSDGSVVGKLGRIAATPGSIPTAGGSNCTGLTFNSGNTLQWCPGGFYQSGSIDGSFNSPSGVVALGNYLYVADTGNHRIVKIDAATGAWVGWSGKINASPNAGTCNGQTGTSSTWCLGGSGTTTASSTVTTPNANLAYGTTATGVNGGNEFRSPTNISTDGTYLYVNDSSNNRIVKLDPSNGRLLGWMGWVYDNTGISCTSGTVPTNHTLNVATQFTDSWCTGGRSTNLNAAQIIGSDPNWIKVGIGWQQSRGISFYDDSVNYFMYVSDSSAGRIIRYTKTEGYYRGWTGRTYNVANAASLPVAPAPIASLMTGTCSATAQSYTMGWCYGGGGQNAGNTNGLNVPYGVRTVAGGNLIIANSGSANVMRLNLATGVYSGYLGRVSTTPTGGTSGCSTTASGSPTPGWCTGGTTTHGYATGSFTRVNNLANGTDGMYDIETDGTKIFTTDRVNYRVAIHNLASGVALGSFGLRIDSLPSSWTSTYAGIPTSGITPTSAILNLDAILNGPYGVTVDNTYMYVADTNFHRIKRYNWNTGSFEGWIGLMATFSPTGGDDACNGAIVGGMTPGWCKGGGNNSTSGSGFNVPRDLVSDGTNLYVTDNSNHRLVKIRSSDGLFLGWIGGVAASGTPSDSLYDVTGCQGANNPATTPNFCLGGVSGASALANGFSSPRAIDGFTDTADGYNPHHYYVIVADSGNNRIQKVNTDLGSSVGWVGRVTTGTCATAGTMTSGWCTNGTVTASNTTQPAANTNNGYMTTPAGIWIDKSVTPITVYVADSGNGKILKFNASTGAYLGWTGKMSGTTTNHGCSVAPTANAATPGWCTGGQMTTGTGNGEYSAPHGITGDSNYLYVTDTTTNRINRINKTTGVFAGWKGRILTQPADSGSFVNPSACLTAAIGEITPDWCFGGTTQPGYKFDLNTPSLAAGLDTPRGITIRGNYLIVVDSGNSRIVQIPK